MNILDFLSFDIVEFVTDPAGIIIIVGIVFLLIGIILLATSNKKTKKEIDTITATKQQPIVGGNMVNEPVNNDINNVQPIEIKDIPAPNLESMPMNLASDLNVPTQSLFEDKKPMQELNVDNNSSAFNQTPAVDTSVNQTVSAVMPMHIEPEITPMMHFTESVTEQAPTPISEPVNIPVIEPTTIYGGTDVKTPVVEEERVRPIYGGANPLDNTAPIPTNEVKQAYGMPTSAMPITQEAVPTVNPVVMPTPTVVPTEATNEPKIMTPAPMPASIDAEIKPVEIPVIPSVVVPSPVSNKEEIETLDF